MELNAKGVSTPQKTVVNEEGSTVLGRLPEIQLYLEASNLSIKEDGFYAGADTKLSSVVNLAKNADPDFVAGLAHFLTDNGLKLSPVVLYSTLSENGYSFRDKKYVLKTFNTPQRIAEAIAMKDMKYVSKLNNSFKQHALRSALEGMSSYTLRKNKMHERKIKTKDLIKLLRPKPKDEYMGTLYKAMIEDSKLSKMDSKESFLRTKADKSLSDEEKIKYFEENISKIPLNELIRNLKFIVDKFGFRKDFEMKVKVIDRLNSIDNYRFLNVFDVMEAMIEVPQLEKPLFEVVERFAKDVKEKFHYDEDAVIMFDVSGSMAGQGERLGFKYAVLLNLIFSKCEVYMFGNNLFPVNEKATSLIRAGKIGEAYKQYEHMNQGTAVMDSFKELLDRKPESKNFVVISDEISWSEGSDLTYYIHKVSTELKKRNGKVILVNPTISSGTVFDTNIVAMSSLTSSVIYNVMLLTNQKAFVRMLKDYNNAKDNM